MYLESIVFSPVLGCSKLFQASSQIDRGLPGQGGVPHRLAYLRREVSLANALCTSDCEIPNCRAIRDAETPALKAARTAFNFPLVKAGGASSTRRLRELSSDTRGRLPRRCCSAKAAATNWSSSGSVSRFIGFGRSLGRTCRMASLATCEDGGRLNNCDGRSRTEENRSGVVEPVRSLPIA